MSYEKISFEIKDDVAYAGFGLNSDKSMATLDEKTLQEFDKILDEVKEKQKGLKGLIIFSHLERCFLAGADINLISSLKTEVEGAEGAESGQKIYNKLEDLKIPTVACIHGVCLGGGLELALSCSHIIASDDKSTVLGLPEVKLGILPGFGGTYRLPKKVGLPKSLELILSGKTVNGKKGKKIELVTEVYPKERLTEMALRHLDKKNGKGGFKDTLEHIAMDNFVGRKVVFQKARESVMKKTKGFYQAPLKILDTMEKGLGKRRDAYLALEAQAFGELCVGEQSKNLQHIFFLTEKSKKYSGPKSTGEVLSLERGACLGAGTMGGGIAWLMAKNDMMPLMKDINLDGLELGLKQSAKNFQGALKRRRMSKEDFERKQRSISAQTDYRGFQRSDLVIEAIVENMDIKKKVFSETEKYVRPDTVLTSNTSSLSITEMSEALEKPERFAGLHFFNPVHLMPLVEIIGHDKAAPETLEALYNWVLSVKKTPVLVNDGPGFLVNRILMPYLNEAAHLIDEGVDMMAIEKACLNFGMPMGPARLMDEVGIDVGVKVAKILHDGLGNRARPAEISHKISEAGFYGKKTSKGFFLYDSDGKQGEINPEIRKFFPSQRKEMSELDIQLRVFLPMVNEAAYILEDGVASCPGDIDLGLIYGIGFPPFRGGLLRYADSEGTEQILDSIKRFQNEVDQDRYNPSPLLEKLVAEKRKFYDL